MNRFIVFALYGIMCFQYCIIGISNLVAIIDLPSNWSFGEHNKQLCLVFVLAIKFSVHDWIKFNEYTNKTSLVAFYAYCP